MIRCIKRCLHELWLDVIWESGWDLCGSLVPPSLVWKQTGNFGCIYLNQPPYTMCRNSLSIWPAILYNSYGISNTLLLSSRIIIHNTMFSHKNYPDFNQHYIFVFSITQYVSFNNKSIHFLVIVVTTNYLLISIFYICFILAWCRFLWHASEEVAESWESCRYVLHNCHELSQ